MTKKSWAIIIIVIIAVVSIGILWRFSQKELLSVTNFTECIVAGNPAMESYPRQCRDGEKTFTEEIDNEVEKTELIRLDSPRPNQVINSPLTITGQARGTWFFEASFPVFLTNWDGLIIAEGIATAKSDWMTEDFVPFEAVLEFDENQTYSNRGALILKKDNPSGLPEYDDALEVPVLIGSGSVKEDIGSALTQTEALNIAQEANDCSMAGILTDKVMYNENSRTWWIDLERMPELEKDGCHPACVVSEDTKTAEVNWRCTGLIAPESSAE